MEAVAYVGMVGTFCGVFCGVVGAMSYFGKQMESLMPSENFLEDLEKLTGFERDALVKAGVLDAHDAVGWEQYCESPAHFILRHLSDGRRDRLLKAMDLRLPPGKASAR
jgi:hypothetical protein